MAQLRHPSHGTYAPSSSTASASASMASTRAAPPVRRNLFHSQLSRRPTTSSTSTSTSAETLRLDGGEAGNGGGGSTTVTASSSVTTTVLDRGEEGDGEGEAGDLVCRDDNGEFLLGELGIEEDEDDEGETWRGEEEREKQRLSDLVRHHQRNRTRAPSEPPGELLEAVKASLRNKVTALADDNWMYEAEDPEPVR